MISRLQALVVLTAMLLLGVLSWACDSSCPQHWKDCPKPDAGSIAGGCELPDSGEYIDPLNGSGLAK